MKTTCISSAIAIITLVSAQNIARAQLVITEATMTDSTVSFSLGGTLSGPAPFADNRQFFIIPSNDPEWLNRTVEGVLFENADSGSGSISIGSLSSSFGNSRLFAENDGFDDIPPSLTFTLNDLPNIGDLGSGTIASTWPADTFNPDIAESTEWTLFWGRSRESALGGPFPGGTLQSSFSVATVPEPHHFTFFSVLGLVTFALYQRRQSSGHNSLPSQLDKTTTASPTSV